jgi:predicted site-specific integrase-resolvase
MEIGGGLNFMRKQFLQLVDAILDGQVEWVVLAHQDGLPALATTCLFISVALTNACCWL